MRTGLTESKYQCGQSLCVYTSLSGAFKVHFAVYLCWCHLKHFSRSPDVMRSINVSSETGGYWTLILLVIFQDKHLTQLRFTWLFILNTSGHIQIYWASPHLDTEIWVYPSKRPAPLFFPTYRYNAAALFQSHSTGRKLKVWRVCLSEFSRCFRWLRILWPDLRARWQNFSTL